jgi:hypothetical protein
MELVISIVIGIVIVEIYAWLPGISAQFLESAVQKLRKDDRDRCREEWSAGLALLPNTLVRLAHAVSFIGAARRINKEYFDASLTEIDASLNELAKKRAKVADFCANSPSTVTTTKKNLEKKLGDLVAATRDNATLKSSEVAVLTMQNLVTATEGFSNSFLAAVCKATDLLSLCIDSAAERLSGVNDKLNLASAKRDRICDLSRNRNSSADEIDSLMHELTDELNSLHSVFGDSQWGDDGALEESTRIWNIILGALKNVQPKRDN